MNTYSVQFLVASHPPHLCLHIPPHPPHLHPSWSQTHPRLPAAGRQCALPECGSSGHRTTRLGSHSHHTAMPPSLKRGNAPWRIRETCKGKRNDDPGLLTLTNRSNRGHVISKRWALEGFFLFLMLIICCSDEAEARFLFYETQLNRARSVIQRDN